MAKENFSELTTEELIKKKKTTTMVTGVLAGMLTVLLVMAILLIIDKGFSYLGLAVVAIALSPVLFMNYNQVSNINIELKSRNPI
jgi:LytS/YehU family sensor histidine kinase